MAKNNQPDKATKPVKPKNQRHPRTYGELLELEREREKAGKKTKWKSNATKPREKVRLPNVDPIFLIVLCMLVGTGLLMMFSASYANATYYMGDSLHYIRKQLFFAVVGFAVMFVASRFPYQYFKKFPLPQSWLNRDFGKKLSGSVPLLVYLLTLVLLGITLFMEPLNNARRWIIVAGITFQPSDLMKFAIVLIFAHYIDKYYKSILAHSFQYGVLPYVCFVIPVALIMGMQPHMSGLIIILLLTAVMMLIGGTKLRYFVLLGGAAVGAVLGLVAIRGADYFYERIEGWLNPLADVSDSTWQTVQSLVSIATGGFWGQGFGNSSQKYLFLPEPQNDFVFAIICEELGFAGALMVIIMFVLLIWRGYSIAIKAKDRFGFMLCVGIISQVAIQVLLNIAVVSNAMPNTGVSLPFFSYGGTSLVILMAEMGVVLNISRSAGAVKTK